MASVFIHWRCRKREIPSIGQIAILLALSLQSSWHLFGQEQLFPVFHFKTLGGSLGNVTARVVRDSLGFVWIGTEGGLVKYDGYGLKEYHNIPNDPSSLPSNSIYSLLVDRKGRLWVGTFDKGLCLYNSLNDQFIQVYPNQDDSSSHGPRTVSRIIQDHPGDIWLALSSPDGLVRVELPAGGGSTAPDSLARSLHFRGFPLGSPRCEAYDVCEGADGKILVVSDSGLVILNPTTATLSRPHLPGALGCLLDTVLIRCLVQGSDGKLWLGTATEGVVGVDWRSGQVVNYRHRDGDSLSITFDDIQDMAEDPRGNLWIGSVKGVDLFSPEIGKRIPYVTFDERPEGNQRIQLSYDCRGTLWVSTRYVVYRLSRRSQLFPHFAFWDRSGLRKGTHPPPWLASIQTIERGPDGKLWSISDGTLREIDLATLTLSKTIVFYPVKRPSEYVPCGPTSSTFDKKGNIWYAAWDLGLYRINPVTCAVNNYTYKTPLGKTTTVNSVVQGTGDTLWIGGDEQGVFKFNPASGRFLETPIKNGYTVMKDHEGRVWATGAFGLNILDPATGRVERFFNVPSDSCSLSQNITASTYEDSLRRIWVSAGNVINLWEPATRSFRRYPNPAFSNNDGTPIGTDRKGRLWIRYSYAGRVSILDPSSGTFTNFDYDDGVCSHVFSMENLENGRILLSGRGGINIVSADSVDPDRTPPPLVITRMTINDEPAVPPRLLKGSGSLRLSHKQDVFEFEFAAIDIDARGPAEYQYQLEGLERGWAKPTDRRYIRYTGVPPGEYVLRVRAASAWGRWPDKEIALAINIAPPWWRTTFAYAGYFLLFIGILYVAYRTRLRQVRLHHEVQLVEFKAEHLAEVDRLKSRFFANISHEFRTPLTLILGPAETIASSTIAESVRENAGIITRNAHRLLRLVNQLLDLSRFEAGQMKLVVRQAGLSEIISGVASSFESVGARRNIRYSIGRPAGPIIGWCDPDAVEKIVANLLSNAFKYTGEGGSVALAIGLETIEKAESASRWVTISVRDTGVGIPRNLQEKIFDRFYQVDDSHTREHEGVGIGLSLTKELVELHKGAIAVESEPGRGSTFTVRLPIDRSCYSAAEISQSELPESATLAGTPPPEARLVSEATAAVATEVAEEAQEPPETEEEELPLLLIVEDNADMRHYIGLHLSSQFRPVMAEDGLQGAEKAIEIIPDLVISDVMMPKMDGFDLCRTLKQDERTSHIPIILLTAKADTSHKIAGLELGADDYLTKPFDVKELAVKAKNLIEQRRMLKERFRSTVTIKPSELAITSVDEKFLRRAISVVEAHMAESQFSTETMAEELALSRTQLYRKMKGLTGDTPSHFIRSLRLQRAAELLRKKAGNVSEIGYEIGFNNPSHFARAFRERFGMTPSEYAAAKEP